MFEREDILGSIKRVSSLIKYDLRNMLYVKESKSLYLLLSATKIKFLLWFFSLEFYHCCQSDVLQFEWLCWQCVTLSSVSTVHIRSLSYVTTRIHGTVQIFSQGKFIFFSKLGDIFRLINNQMILRTFKKVFILMV